MLAERFGIRPWEIDGLDYGEFCAFEDAIWRDVMKQTFSPDD